MSRGFSLAWNGKLKSRLLSQAELGFTLPPQDTWHLEQDQIVLVLQHEAALKG